MQYISFFKKSFSFNLFCNLCSYTHEFCLTSLKALGRESYLTSFEDFLNYLTEPKAEEEDEETNIQSASLSALGYKLALLGPAVSYGTAVSHGPHL